MSNVLVYHIIINLFFYLSKEGGDRVATRCFSDPLKNKNKARFCVFLSINNT